MITKNPLPEHFTVRIDSHLSSRYSLSSELNFELLSLETAAALLAEQGAKYLEGQKLNKMFNDLRGDIDQMLNHAVARMQAFVAEKIDASNVTRCQSLIDGCYLALREYENNPENSDRLYFAVTNSASAIYELRTFGWRYFECFADAASVRVLALAVLTKVTGSRGELANLKSFVQFATNVLEQFMSESSHHFNTLVAGITLVSFSNEREHCRFSKASGNDICTYYCNAAFSDNGEDINRDVRGSMPEDARTNAYNIVNPWREQRLAQRTVTRDKVAADLQKNYALRVSLWSECISKAGQIAVNP